MPNKAVALACSIPVVHPACPLSLDSSIAQWNLLLPPPFVAPGEDEHLEANVKLPLAAVPRPDPESEIARKKGRRQPLGGKCRHPTAK